MKQTQHLTVSGTLIIDSKVLLVRRAAHETAWEGYWEFPSGKVEFGESTEQALVREFLEEVSINIKPVSIYRTFSYTYSKNQEHRHVNEFEYFVLLAENDSVNNIKISNDHDKWGFFTYEQTKELKSLSDEKRMSLKVAFGL